MVQLRQRIVGSRGRRRRDIVDRNAGQKRLERVQLMLQPKQTSRDEVDADLSPEQMVRKRQPVAGRRDWSLYFPAVPEYQPQPPGVATEEHRRLQIAITQPARTIDLRTFLRERTWRGRCNGSQQMKQRRIE